MKKKTILQWNPNGFYNNLEELQLLVQRHSPSIICIQESRLLPKQNPLYKNYTIYRRDHTEGQIASGGVVTLVQNESFCSHIRLNTRSSLQHVSIKVHQPKLSSVPFTVCNLYIPPNFEPTYEDILELCQQLPHPYLLLGDFNSHSPWWGCSLTNNRGKLVERLLLEEGNIVLLNDGSHTRFNTSNGTSSAIDLTLASTLLASHLKWETNAYLCNSDHYPIFITHSSDQEKILHTKLVKKWLCEKADWPKYRNNCTLTNLNVNQNINDVVSQLNERILSAAEQSVPRSSGIFKKKMVPWWCAEIKAAIKQRNKALQKFRLSRQLEDLIAFRRYKAIARRTIRTKKRESWQKFSNSIQTSPPANTTEMWKKIKLLYGRSTFSTITEIHHDGKTSQENQEIANAFATYFASASATSQYSAKFQQIKLRTESLPLDLSSTNEEWFNKEFTFSELESSLYSFKKQKSPGPDNIPLLFLQKLKQEDKNKLLSIFNKIWIEQTFPSLWSSAVIIPLLKPGKNRLQLSSYRPIALTCITCKVIEKMISSRLLNYLEGKDYFTNYQCGFRRNRSTQDQIINLAYEVKTAFQEKKDIYSIFFDIQKAYDRTWRHYVLQQLLQANIRGRSAAFIKNYLYNRTIQVRINTTISMKTTIENGVPQGGVLSILCFLLAMNNIVSKIPLPIKCRLFADDLNITIKTKDPLTAETLLQATLNNLEKWSSNETGLDFSAEKTKCVLFTKKRKYYQPLLKLNGTALPFVTHHSFLGVIFDCRLNWHVQLKQLKIRALKNLTPLKMLKNRKFGPEPRCLINLYRTLVRSILDYGCIAFSSAASTTLKTLDSVHTAGIRLALRAFPTSPNIAMQLLSAEPPLHIRRAYLMLKYCSKLSKNDQHINYKFFYTDLHTIINETVKNWTQKAAITPFPTDKVMQTKLIEYWIRSVQDTVVHPLLQNSQDWLHLIYKKCDQDLSSTIAIIRIFIGHTLITHQYLLQSQNEPLCHTCPNNPRISIDHIIFHCIEYTTARNLYLRNLTPTSLYSIESIPSLRRFLIHCNLVKHL